MGCENNLDDDLEVLEIGLVGRVSVRGLEGIGYFLGFRVRVCVWFESFLDFFCFAGSLGFG